MLAFALAAAGCNDPCMVDGYTRYATGSVDYTLSAQGDGADLHGAMPGSFTMHRFATFEDGACSLDDNTFAIEIAPTCKVRATVDAREYDTGKNASHNFLQAEASVAPNQLCALRLEDGSWVNGRIASGSLAVMPRTARLSLALDVHEHDGVGTRGYLRMTMDGSWH